MDCPVPSRALQTVNSGRFQLTPANSKKLLAMAQTGLTPAAYLNIYAAIPSPCSTQRTAGPISIHRWFFLNRGSQDFCLRVKTILDHNNAHENLAFLSNLLLI